MKKTDAIIKTNEDPRRKTDFCVGFKCPIDDVYAFFDIGTGPTPSGSGGYVNIRSLRFDYDGIKVDHCGLEQGRFLCDWNAEEIATVKNVLARPVFTHSGSNVNFYTNTYQNRNTSAEILFSEGQTVLSIEKKDVRKPMSAQMKALHDKIIAFVETKSDGDTRKKQIIISAIKDQIGRIQEKEKNQDKRNEWAGLVESLSLYYSY